MNNRGKLKEKNKQHRRNLGSGDRIFFKNSQNTVALVPSNSVTSVHTLTLSTQGCLLHASVPAGCDPVIKIDSLVDLVPRTCNSASHTVGAKSLGEADGNRKGRQSAQRTGKPRWLLSTISLSYCRMGQLVVLLVLSPARS